MNKFLFFSVCTLLVFTGCTTSYPSQDSSPVVLNSFDSCISTCEDVYYVDFLEQEYDLERVYFSRCVDDEMSFHSSVNLSQDLYDKYYDAAFSYCYSNFADYRFERALDDLHFNQSAFCFHSCSNYEVQS
jgi:hypothetical protein